MNKEAQQRYDRQIRLWGLDAQKRMLGSKMLVVNLGGIGVEIVKNIVLSGVGSVHIVDDNSVTVEDCTNNFFVREDEVGKNRGECSVPRIQQLNPFVKVTCENVDINSLSPDWWGKFDVACLTECPKAVQLKANEICREKSVKFMAANSFGLLGMFFSDFGAAIDYTVTTEDPKRGKTTVQRADSFITLAALWNATNWSSFKPSPCYLVCQIIQSAQQDVSNDQIDVALLKKMRDTMAAQHGFDASVVPDSFLEDNFQQCFGEFSPISTIVGGEAAQEILKVVQLSIGAPLINNTFVFDGVDTYRGLVEKAG